MLLLACILRADETREFGIVVTCLSTSSFSKVGYCGYSGSFSGKGVSHHLSHKHAIIQHLNKSHTFAALGESAANVEVDLPGDIGEGGSNREQSF